MGESYRQREVREGLRMGGISRVKREKENSGVIEIHKFKDNDLEKERNKKIEKFRNSGRGI